MGFVKLFNWAKAKEKKVVTGGNVAENQTMSKNSRIFFFFWWYLARTQGLYLEPLHQSFLCVPDGCFRDRIFKLFAQAGFEPQSS
jgi:hypothetical protein